MRSLSASAGSWLVISFLFSVVQVLKLTPIEVSPLDKEEPPASFIQLSPSSFWDLHANRHIASDKRRGDFEEESNRDHQWLAGC